MKLIIMGPVGSGKGTQAKLISEKLGIVHVSTGDIMRRHVREKTEIGIKIKTILDKGGYVDDKLSSQLLIERLNESDAKNGFILDGFPRTLHQANILSDITQLDRVIYLVVDNETIINRLGGRIICNQCGSMYHKFSRPPKEENICDNCGGILFQREDDKKEVIKKRLQIYEEQTLPIIDYYKSVNILTKINAEGTVEYINTAIFKELNNL